MVAVSQPNLYQFQNFRVFQNPQDELNSKLTLEFIEKFNQGKCLGMYYQKDFDV